MEGIHASGEVGSPVAQVIRRLAHVIIGHWQEAARELPPAGNLPDPILRDDVPDVLEAIAARLEAAEVYEPEEQQHAAREHAVQRLSIGFELAHVLMEYGILRRCILEV